MGQLRAGAAERRVNGSSERVDSREFAADRQLVDRLGAFVSNNTFEVQHVTDWYVLGADARAAEHVARIAGHIERHPAVIPLRERHLRGCHFALVFESTQLQRQELGRSDPSRHVGEPDLDRLVLSQRAAEEYARLRVIQHLRQARLNTQKKQ